MLKKITTTLVLSFVAMYTFAQSKITVQVLTEQKNAISGATISINQITKQSNASGFATFDVANQTENHLRVKHLGYQNHAEILNSSNREIIVILKNNLHQTGEVQVFATRAKENSASTYKNLSKEDIRKNNLGQDIPYLLDQTPGVIIGSDAGAGIGYTNMRIRGSDNQRINVTLNGIPLNDAESMGSFFVNLPDFASSVQSIQIQRGIGTSTNGAGAFGASLNIQTDTLQSNSYAELNNTFGSFNTWKNTLKVGSGLINNKYAFNARLSRVASDGYVDRATSDLKSFYIDAGLYTNKHILKATIFSGKEKTYQAWNGVPEDKLSSDRTFNEFTYENQTDNYTQTHSHLHYTNFINKKWTLNTALHYTRGLGYYEEFRENDKLANYGIENVVIKDATNTVLSEIKRSDLIRRRWLDNHFYGLTYNINYKPNSLWNLSIGGAANQYLGDHYGQVIWAQYASNSTNTGKYYLNDAKKTDINVFAKADYKIDRWLLNIDLQVRNVDYKIDGNDNKIKNINIEDNLFFFNPKFGATYFINPFTNLYASYAYSGKEPVRKDYVENPIGAFPNPEYMQDIEAGYRFNNNKFVIGANLYAMLYKDQLIPTGALNDTGGELRINTPKSHRIGIEVDGKWNISEKFSWSATAAISQNKIKDFIEYIPILNDDWDKVAEQPLAHGNTNIAMSPSTVLSNNLSYKPTERLAFSLLSKYVSRLYLDNTSAKERSINPYFTHNAQAIYSFSAFGMKAIDLNLSVNNLFNAKYETNGYTWRQRFESKTTIEHYNYYYPQAGTNFLFGLNIRF